jgi:ABC-2 type transport system ATP-binding protein
MPEEGRAAVTKLAATGILERSAAGEGEAAVSVRGLEKTYRDGWLSRHDVHALRGVTFRVERGEIFGLLGPNGAGKTTLIKILLGIVKQTRGEATMLGGAAGDRRIRRRVGYLPENNRVPRHHTGFTALEYFGGLSGLSPREVRRRRDELLKLVGLESWGDVSVRKYSKGMQQRLGLAQALLHDPELLILDEPTDGVDPVGRSEMRSLLVELKQAGKTIFLNSHHLQEIELVCDRVAIMQRGEVRREGRVADLTLSPRTEVYLTLQGDADAIRGAVGDRRIIEWQSADAEQHTISVRIEDQEDSNRLIDALRAAGISVVGLARHRQTLEEAFLAALADDGPANEESS